MPRPKATMAAALLAVSLVSACSGSGGDDRGPSTTASSTTSSTSTTETTTTTEAPAPEDGDPALLVPDVVRAIVDGGRAYAITRVDQGLGEGLRLVSIDLEVGFPGPSGDDIQEFEPEAGPGETVTVVYGDSANHRNAQPPVAAGGATDLRLWRGDDGSPVLVAAFSVASEGDGIDPGRNEYVFVAFDAETRQQLWTVSPSDPERPGEPDALYPGADGAGVMRVCDTDPSSTACYLQGIDPRTGEELWAKDRGHLYVLGLADGRFVASAAGTVATPSGLVLVDPANGSETPIGAQPGNSAVAGDAGCVTPGGAALSTRAEGPVSQIVGIDGAGAVGWRVDAFGLGVTACSPDGTGAYVSTSALGDDGFLDLDTGEVRWTLSPEQSGRFDLIGVFDDGVSGRTPTGPVLLAAADGAQSPLPPDDCRVVGEPWRGAFADEAGLAVDLRGEGLYAWHASEPPTCVMDGPVGDRIYPSVVFAS